MTVPPDGPTVSLLRYLGTREMTGKLLAVKARLELVWAAAFWDLREQGCLEMVLWEPRNRWVRGQLDVRATKPAVRAGLEGAIMQALAGRSSPMRFKQAANKAGLVKAWHLSVEHEGRELGVLSSKGSFWRGYTPPVPDPDGLAALAPAIEHAAERWKAFTATEPELSAAMMDRLDIDVNG